MRSTIGMTPTKRTASPTGICARTPASSTPSSTQWQSGRPSSAASGTTHTRTRTVPAGAASSTPTPSGYSDYRAQRVDLGRADGHLLVFPLSPNALGEWPGLPGTPVTGPPGDHRVVFDDHGIFAGVATLYTDDPDGTRLIWCYPIHDNGAREVGATAEGNSGVDEAWMDEYDGLHYLYGPDPMGGSHPPP
ncbi:hypothetical protein M434DRAFT_265379 [Hypoxylon sp. CO27-5]|nr:hypothetical protein M434DRAFT_265379 [Hypoxylon sp. CO27-5]